MKGCLLCLDIKQDSTDNIKFESVKWNELNVQHLIEKHFWPMEVLQTTGSWLCNDCWQKLYDFHTFYERIEGAHMGLSSIVNSLDSVTNIDTENEDFKPPMEKVIFDTRHFESDTLIKKESFQCENFIVQDVIKEERDSELIIEDTVPLIRYKKTRIKKINEHRTVAEDPLCKKNKCRRTYPRKTRNSKLNVSRNVRINFKKNLEKKDAIDDSHVMEINEDEVANIDSNQTSDSDSNFWVDKDNQEKEGEKKLNSKSSNGRHHANDKFLKENFKITCSVCQIQTETFHALCKHFKNEHKQIGFVICCKKKFYRRSLLVDHIHQHVDPNYFKCTICDKVMADRKCLNMHNKTHNQKKEKVHPCDICNKKFSMYMSLKLHKMSHLSEDEKHVPCTECGKKFASKSLLSNHVRSVHLKKYINICDICGRSIRCKEVFQRHMLQHEGKPLPTVSCDVCGLLLANKHSLKQHKIMVHPEGGKKEYSCPVCSKISPNLKAHKKHVQYNHELGYNHKCTMCEKAFKTAHTLTEHMASHTGIVLYTCPWCPKTFNSNANFHSHRKKMHRKQWEEVTRKKYSGNLPPNYNPPPTSKSNDCELPIYM